MDAVKFLQERERMCRSCHSCGDCPLWGMRCDRVLDVSAESLVDAVEQWAAAHPRKTWQSVFLEQYPEAEIDANGLLTVCPAPIFHSHRLNGGGCRNVHKSCEVCRREFWMQEVE